LKFARPRWTKAVKLVQLGSIVCMYAGPILWHRTDKIIVIAVYGVLFMEWNLDTSEQGKQPFSGVSYICRTPHMC
jgi:hypothetical protein